MKESDTGPQPERRTDALSNEAAESEAWNERNVPVVLHKIIAPSSEESEPEQGTDALDRKLCDETVESGARNEDKVPVILRRRHEMCAPSSEEDAHIHHPIYQEALESKARNEDKVPVILWSDEISASSSEGYANVPRQVRTEAMEFKARNRAAVLPMNLQTRHGAISKESIYPIALTESLFTSQGRPPTWNDAATDDANCSLSTPVAIAQPIDACVSWHLYRQDRDHIENDINMQNSIKDPIDLNQSVDQNKPIVDAVNRTQNEKDAWMCNRRRCMICSGIAICIIIILVVAIAVSVSMAIKASDRSASLRGGAVGSNATVNAPSPSGASTSSPPLSVDTMAPGRQ